MKKNAIQVVSSFLSMRKDFSPGQWSFFGPGSEKKRYSTHENNPQGEWDRVAEQMIFNVCRKQTPNLPIHESRVLKSKGGENCRYTLLPMGRRLKLFFAQSFMLISSVFTEQSQIRVKNVILAMIEQGDLLWQDNLTHCSSQV